MPVRILGGLRYTPADLGLNAVALGAGLTVVGVPVPWRDAFLIRTVAWHLFWTDVGAITADVFAVRFQGSTQITFPTICHQNFTGVAVLGGIAHNWGMMSARAQGSNVPGSVGSGVLPVSGSAMIAGALLFDSPAIRFSIRNNSALAIADMSMEASLLE